MKKIALAAAAVMISAPAMAGDWGSYGESHGWQTEINRIDGILSGTYTDHSGDSAVRGGTGWAADKATIDGNITALDAARDDLTDGIGDINSFSGILQNTGTGALSPITTTVNANAYDDVISAGGVLQTSIVTALSGRPLTLPSTTLKVVLWVTGLVCFVTMQPKLLLTSSKLVTTTVMVVLTALTMKLLQLSTTS